MALTLTRKHGPYSMGNCWGVVYEIAFGSGGYTSGGESLSAASIGAKTILHVGTDPVDATSATLAYNFDYTNSKLMAFYPTGGSGTAPATPVAPVVSWPSGPTTVTANAAVGIDVTETPGVAKQLATTTADLSAYKVRAWIVFI